MYIYPILCVCINIYTCILPLAIEHSYGRPPQLGVCIIYERTMFHSQLKLPEGINTCIYI